MLGSILTSFFPQMVQGFAVGLHVGSLKAAVRDKFLNPADILPAGFDTLCRAVVAGLCIGPARWES